MTIKRRLFLSNILMLVTPMILTMVVFSCIVFIYLGITGTKNTNSFREGNIFYGVIEKVNTLMKTFSHTDFQNMRTDIDYINKTFMDYGIALAVYEDGTLMYPSSAVTNNVTEIVLSENKDYLLIEGNNAAYSSHTGIYTFILSSTDFSLYPENSFNDYYYFGIFIFILMLFIIFSVNRFLTHFITKRITTPIDILVSGVHEIRDGNLDFRIKYNYKDEFSTICSDFNDMAQRLSDMVKQRQKDENNRKELIAGISHDLRTPLTSIKAYIEGIEKGVASSPQMQKKYFDTIKGKTSELEYTINQLFLFSKLDTPDFPFTLERVDIGDELDKMIAVLADEYKDNGLSISLKENVRGIYTAIDTMQFRSVIHNILGNSVKYRNKDNIQVEVFIRDNNDNIIVSITDDGPGVSETAIDKLFEVFYREDSSRQNPDAGSGLGLAISAKIIQRLNGTISAENAHGGGLRVNITLPKDKGGSEYETNINR